MKIIHLSTYDIGGAAVAAQRLHIGLLQQGVNSSFLSLKSSTVNAFPGKSQFSLGSLPFYKKVIRKIGFPVTRGELNKALLKNRTGNYEAFSFPLTDHCVEDHTLLKEADIVHLHWVSNFINYPSFFQKIQKPIVWTLHDMNPLLGGFHYLGDKQRYAEILGDLDAKLTARKVDALKRAYSITIVTPSKWLGENLFLNDVLKRAAYRHIPYSLDLTVFKPFDKVFAKSVFNLPINKKIILFVSERIDNYRKGFDLLSEAIDQINLGDDYAVVAIGAAGDSSFKGRNPAISLGKINDDRMMSLIFSAADVFVLPSREDNFPNVMLESMACGTPVLAFDVGGMKDVIQHGFNGLLTGDMSAAGLRSMLEEFISGRISFSREAIRDFACRHFDLSIQAKNYITLYNELLSRHPNKY